MSFSFHVRLEQGILNSYEVSERVSRSSEHELAASPVSSCRGGSQGIECYIIIIIIIQKICSAHISTLLGAQGANPETPGRASPFSFTISVLDYFTCLTQHTGPTSLRPIRRTKQLWLSVLLKDTSAPTGQAGIRTHILTTPELESNVLDRSATSLNMIFSQKKRFKAIIPLLLCSVVLHG